MLRSVHVVDESDGSGIRPIVAPTRHAPERLPTVYYGLSGEGQGHAARAIPIIDHLRTQTDVVALTSGRALDVLTERYTAREIEVRRVPGLRFEYNSSGRLSPTKTAMVSWTRVNELERHTQALTEELRQHRSVVISDFEPISLNAAQRANVPSLSVDHQRLLQACCFDHLPLRIRANAAMLDALIRLFYGTPKQLVVSGFHLPPLRSDYAHARTAGVLIRDELRRLRPVNDGYLLAYVRKGCPPLVLKTLESSPLPVHLYGLGEQAPRGSLTFHAPSQTTFAQHLAACSAVVCTAGNQLIGEAFYLNKPVLAFPEPGNPEQHINAHLLGESGGGRAVSHRKLTATRLESFLRALPTLRANLRHLGIPGNQVVLDAVDQLLRSAQGAGPRTGFRSVAVRAKPVRVGAQLSAAGL